MRRVAGAAHGIHFESLEHVLQDAMGRVRSIIERLVGSQGAVRPLGHVGPAALPFRAKTDHSQRMMPPTSWQFCVVFPGWERRGAPVGFWGGGEQPAAGCSAPGQGLIPRLLGTDGNYRHIDRLLDDGGGLTARHPARGDRSSRWNRIRLRWALSRQAVPGPILPRRFCAGCPDRAVLPKPALFPSAKAFAVAGELSLRLGFLFRVIFSAERRFRDSAWARIAGMTVLPSAGTVGIRMAVGTGAAAARMKRAKGHGSSRKTVRGQARVRRCPVNGRPGSQMTPESPNSDLQSFHQSGFQLMRLALLRKSPPLNRKTSSTRSPRVAILAVQIGSNRPRSSRPYREVRGGRRRQTEDVVRAFLVRAGSRPWVSIGKCLTWRESRPEAGVSGGGLMNQPIGQFVPRCTLHLAVVVPTTTSRDDEAVEGERSHGGVVWILASTML